jgi:hypothetical protein
MDGLSQAVEAEAQSLPEATAASPAAVAAMSGPAAIQAEATIPGRGQASSAAD